MGRERSESAPGEGAWRRRLFEVIFEADTPAGKGFDVALLVTILVSVLLVMLESVASIRARHEEALRAGEWAITVLFTIEYALRLVCVQRPARYALSFFGIVDLLAILPTFLGLFVSRSQGLLVIRAIRLVRIFRIFKLARFVSEAALLRRALLESRAKITVFLTTVIIAVTIVGAAMHLIEGEQAGFTSIPQSMYWAVVTMTTVGYGDVAPETTLGKLLATLIMILGYALIVVPTGIISAELARAERPLTTQSCPACTRQGHDRDARHCKFCGAAL